MGAVQEARRSRDMPFCFPGTAFGDEQPQWEPLLLKTLKELQMAFKFMGPSFNTLQTLDMIGSICLTPYDWYQRAKSILSPGQYWKTQYKDGAQDIVLSQREEQNQLWACLQVRENMLLYKLKLKYQNRF